MLKHALVCASATERPYPGEHRNLVFLTSRALAPSFSTAKVQLRYVLDVGSGFATRQSGEGSACDEVLRNVPPFREVCPRLEDRVHDCGFIGSIQKDTTSVL